MTFFVTKLFNIFMRQTLTDEVTATDFAPASNKEFLDIQATIEYGFTLKRVRDIIKTYSTINR